MPLGRNVIATFPPSPSKVKPSIAGLEHLKGLTNLDQLHLDGTQVTDAGVKKLNQILRNCHIWRHTQRPK